MNNNVYCRQESRIRYSILSISFPGQLLAIQSHHKPEMFAHLGQCHPVSICCLLSGHLPAPQVPLQIPLFPCFEEQATLPLSQIPGQKISGSLFASSPPPLHLFSAPGAPFSTLSPRQHSQDIPSSPPLLSGPGHLPSFDHSAVPHCLPAHSSFLHLQVGSLPSCLLPMPWLSQFSSEGSPLALCR